MIKLPKNWLDITFYQYTELVDIEMNDYDNKIIEQLAVLLDTSVEDPDITNLDLEEVFEIFKNLKWLKNPIPKKIEKNYNDKRLKDFNELNLGEFIDIEYFLSNEPVKNKTILAAIMYRNFKYDEWGNIIYEPYLYNPIDRCSEFDGMSICYIEGLVDSYMKFKENFMKNYDQLFEKNEEPEQIENLTGVEARDLKKAILEEQKKRKWGYENLIWSLSNGDITKFNQIFEMKLILVFNILSMRKSLGIE